jgi:hypothetical protein
MTVFLLLRRHDNSIVNLFATRALAESQLTVCRGRDARIGGQAAQTEYRVEPWPLLGALIPTSL